MYGSGKRPRTASAYTAGTFGSSDIEETTVVMPHDSSALAGPPLPSESCPPRGSLQRLPLGRLGLQAGSQARPRPAGPHGAQVPSAHGRAPESLSGGHAPSER